MKNKFIKILRYIILAILLIHITVEAYFHQLLGGGEAPSIHALCPYGGLESIYSLIFADTFIKKIFSGTLILLIITVVIALIFRRSFCGLICPFGALQEFFGILGKSIFKKRFMIPDALDKPLRYLKYVVLVVTLFFAWTTSGLWVDKYDPWAAYGHMSAGIESLSTEYLIGFILLILTLIGSLLYDRFFCKYLCPMGAFYGIVAKLSPSKITRNEDTCVNCKLCDKSCPVNIKVSEVKEIKSAECINCQSCILSCPKNNTLEFKVKDKAVKPIYIFVIVFLIFFGGIGVARITGNFEITAKPITGESKINLDEIKGYMTLEDLSKGLGMDLREVYKKLDLPASISKETKLKDIKNIVPDFEVEGVKEKLE